MADNTENPQSEEGQDAAENAQPEDAASLKGKGWDILVGGEENAASMGGADPFDDSTPEDHEADSILGGAAASAAGPGTQGVPGGEAFWDRGRGSEATGAVPTETDQTVEAPPRDLTPEELGAAAPASPAAGPQPVTPPPSGAPAAMPAVSFDELTAPPAAASGEAAPAGALPSEGEAIPVGEGMPMSTVDMGSGPVPDAEADVPFGGAADSATPFGSDAGAAPFGATDSEAAPFGGAVPPAAVPAIDAGVPGMAVDGPGSQSAILAAASVGAAGTRIYDPFAGSGSDDESLIDTANELSADKALEGQLVTKERVDALWDEIDQTYDLVINDVRGYFKTTEHSIRDLKRARELLLSGLDNFDNAEELVKLVKARLRLEEKIRQWSATRGVWLTVYLLVWLLLLSVSSLMTNRAQLVAAQLVPTWLAATILPGLFGGLGGIVGALWVLVKHIARDRDFDPIHTLWYVTNPFLGIALGVITYFLLQVSGNMLGTTDLTTSASGAFAVYALSVIVGFNQNVLWALVDRVIKAIVPPSDSTGAGEQMSGQPQQ